jgi:hypothetical protein
VTKSDQKMTLKPQPGRAPKTKAEKGFWHLQGPPKPGQNGVKNGQKRAKPERSWAPKTKTERGFGRRGRAQIEPIFGFGAEIFSILYCYVNI